MQPGSWGEARRKWDARLPHSCSMRTFQVAARLVGRGTKKMGRSPTTLMQYEDFSGCSQARGARHEEKSDASLRHSCSTRTFQVAARLVGRGTKKNRTLACDTHAAWQASKGEALNLDRYPILDILLFLLMMRPISAFRLYRDF